MGNAQALFKFSYKSEGNKKDHLEELSTDGKIILK
jgi:hypothetical protein